MSDFNNIATFRLADASKIDNLPANTNSELAGKAAASHTHDDIYYTETETNSLLNGKQSVSEKGQPSGYASLDGTGKVPASQLPATVVDGDMSKSTYDTNDNGIVDNSEKLGGQLPSYYLDVDNHTDGTTNKVYTTTEKTKLAGIEAGAEVNTINSVVAGTNISIDNTDPLNPIISATGGGGGSGDVTGPASSTNNGVVLFDGTTGKIIKDSAKTIVTTLGGDDTTIPTSKAVADAIGSAGGGDMLKSVYDTNNDGIVDNSEALNGQDGSYYLDRGNHTGTQAISTIDGLQTALNGKAALSGATFTGDITATNLSGTNTGDQDLSGYALTSSLATVATSGSYNDLSDKPSIPDNTDFVDLTTAQTVGGVKTFSSSPIVPTPTADMEVATKKYVDDNAGKVGTKEVDETDIGDDKILVYKTGSGKYELEDKPAGGGSSTKSTFVAGENITAGNALRNGRGDTLNITSINNLTSATDIKLDGTRIGYSVSEQYIGQSFTLTGLENYLNSISVKLGKSGSPTGNLTMKIYSNTGTTLIATSSNTISESSIVSGNTYTFNFANYIPTGIPLYIRIETSRANSTSAYSWIYFSSTSSITGDFYQISSTNSWSILSTYDMGMNINTSIIEDITKVYKTSALLSTTSNFYGFATNAVSTGGNVILDTSGVSATQSGLTIGSYYYLSDIPGAISTTPGTNIVSVGKAVSTTGIEINNNFVNNDTIIISLQQNFATTTVINHNLGRIPEKIEFQHISALSNGQHSKGIYKNGTNKCIYYHSGTSPYAYSDNTKCCKDGYGFTAYVSAVTSTTFTLVNTANSGSSSYLQIIATLS